MAYEYSNNEYTEMVRVLAKSHDNVARACHEFGRLFPKLPAPSRELMLQATQRLRDHGQFQPGSSETVSEEDEEAQESGDDGEEGDDEEGDDEEGNEEEGEVEKQEEKEEVLKPKKEPTESPMPLPAGKGFPLGQISNVEVSLSRFKTQDQKILHQYLYGQLCPDCNVTGNIMNFKGFQWSFNSTEYKAKLMETARMDPRHLRAMCEMLDLENKGGPSELATRLMGFLQQPGANFPEVSPKPPFKTDIRGAASVRGPRRTRSHSPPSVTYCDEEHESDRDTKADEFKEGSEDSDLSASTKTSGSAASVAGSEGEDVIGNEGREAEARVIPDSQSSPPKNKKNARDMLVRSTKGEKASSEESYEGEESSEEEEEEASDQEESGEESDSPADKKAKRPPTDEEIKKYVKQIMEGANLEQVTMKTVCKQVYSHYPDFNLEHKKEFIKSTVKSFADNRLQRQMTKFGTRPPMSTLHPPLAQRAEYSLITHRDKQTSSPPDHQKNRYKIEEIRIPKILKKYSLLILILLFLSNFSIFVSYSFSKVITAAFKMDLQFLNMLRGVQDLPTCEVSDPSSDSIFLSDNIKRSIYDEDAQNYQAIK